MQWTNDQPIYLQVRDHVVSLIIDGVLDAGDSIPSVRQMAVEGGVNPLTVSKAYQELVHLNIVENRRGLGMFVTEPAKNQLLKIEKEKFLKGDWPAILRKAQQLDIDLIKLVNSSNSFIVAIQTPLSFKSAILRAILLNPWPYAFALITGYISALFVIDCIYRTLCSKLLRFIIALVVLNC